MLALRPMTVNDLPVVEPWFDDPETNEWLGDRSWPSMVLALPPKVLGECRDGVTTVARQAYVATAPPDSLVGLVDVEVYDDRSASLSFVVAPHARRRGVGRAVLAATEALDMLQGVDRIEAGAEPGNVASIRCLRAAGYDIGGEIDYEGVIWARRALTVRPDLPGRRSTGDGEGDGCGGADVE